MSEVVLFSPLGTTDPYRDCYEGAMLHIIRHYNPSCIHLFLSREIEKEEDKDQRYTRAIRRQHSVLFSQEKEPQVVLHTKPDLFDPSDFDLLTEPFKEVIDQIIDSLPSAEILLNTSSGTPQMKLTTSLIGVSQYRDRKYRMIQVKNPSKKSGMDQKHLVDYIDEDVEQLFDNDMEAENRCVEPNLSYFDECMRYEQFKKLIHMFDYSGAKEIADRYPDDFPAEVVRIVRHMALREDYAFDDADKQLTPEDFEKMEFRPVQTKNWRKIYEFFMAADIRYRREEWSDYLMRLSPLLTNLIEAYISNVYHLDVKSLCTGGKDKFKLSAKKIQKHDSKMLQHLDQSQSNGKFADSYISLNNLLQILRYLHSQQPNNHSNPKIIKLFEELREIEELLRNDVAHQMIHVTSDWAKDKSGKSFRDIHALMKDLLARISGTHFREGWRDLPDRVNTYILKIGD